MFCLCPDDKGAYTGSDSLCEINCLCTDVAQTFQRLKHKDFMHHELTMNSTFKSIYYSKLMFIFKFAVVHC